MGPITGSRQLNSGDMETPLAHGAMPHSLTGGEVFQSSLGTSRSHASPSRLIVDLKASTSPGGDLDPSNDVEIVFFSKPGARSLYRRSVSEQERRIEDEVQPEMTRAVTAVGPTPALKKVVGPSAYSSGGWTAGHYLSPLRSHGAAQTHHPPSLASLKPSVAYPHQVGHAAGSLHAAAKDTVGPTAFPALVRVGPTASPAGHRRSSTSSLQQRRSQAHTRSSSSSNGSSSPSLWEAHAPGVPQLDLPPLFVDLVAGQSGPGSSHSEGSHRSGWAPGGGCRSTSNDRVGKKPPRSPHMAFAAIPRSTSESSRNKRPTHQRQAGPYETHGFALGAEESCTVQAPGPSQRICACGLVAEDCLVCDDPDSADATFSFSALCRCGLEASQCSVCAAPTATLRSAAGTGSRPVALILGSQTPSMEHSLFDSVCQSGQPVAGRASFNTTSPLGQSLQAMRQSSPGAASLAAFPRIASASASDSRVGPTGIVQGATGSRGMRRSTSVAERPLGAEASPSSTAPATGPAPGSSTGLQRSRSGHSRRWTVDGCLLPPSKAPAPSGVFGWAAEQRMRQNQQ